MYVCIYICMCIYIYIYIVTVLVTFLDEKLLLSFITNYTIIGMIHDLRPWEEDQRFDTL